MNPQILEYIRVQRAAGNPDDIIAQNLRATGWPEDMIAQGLKAPASAPPLAPVPSATLRPSKQLLNEAIDAVRSKLTILVLLGAIAGAPSIVGSFSTELVDLAAGNGATLIMLIIVFIILIIAASILSVISTIGIVTVLIHRDREVTFQEAFMTGLQKFIPFSWVLFLTGFIEMGGLILFIIPGILFMIWFIFSYYVFLMEGVTGMNALLRSREYVRGYAVPILNKLGFLTIINIFVFIIFGIITAFIPSEPAKNILENALSVILNPISIAYILFIYEDLRAIKGSVEHQVSRRNKKIYLGVACLGFLIVLGGIVWGIFQVVDMVSRASSSGSSIQNSVDRAFSQANDTKRKSDIHALQNALNGYKRIEDAFPPTLDLLVPDYISIVPQDPDGGSYDYELIPGGDDYRLCTTYIKDGRVCVTSTTTPAL